RNDDFRLERGKAEHGGLSLAHGQAHEVLQTRLLGGGTELHSTPALSFGFVDTAASLNHRVAEFRSNRIEKSVPVGAVDDCMKLRLERHRMVGDIQAEVRSVRLAIHIESLENPGEVSRGGQNTAQSLEVV